MRPAKKRTRQEEFHRRLTWIADHLDADLDDLLDWYRDDAETVCEMAGKDLLKTVEEYLSIRDWYRSHRRTNTGAKT